jgi:N-acetylglucosamine-6-sulfatase
MNVFTQRRTAGSLIVVATAVLFLRCGGSSDSGDSSTTPTTPTTPVTTPNLVLILTDDQDLATMVHMPIVRDRLAARGLSFNNAFVTDSLCCPSRATILTGQYAHNHGVQSNEPPQGGFDVFRDLGHERNSLGLWLNRGGYATALIGKYLNRYPGTSPANYIPPGWTDWYSFFSNVGSDAYYNYSMNESGTVVRYGTRPEDYITDVLATKTLQFLDRAEANDAKPFFLHITPNAPHRPSEPAPRHASLLPNVQMPRTPNWNEADLSDKPAWLRNVFQPLSRSDENVVDYLFQQRSLSLLAVDELVGRVLDKLEALGEMSNTYVIFTSDNGFLQGSHRFVRGKDAPYEESIRVPLIVRGPNIRAGSTSDSFVLNNDFAPTLLELAGVAIPASVDGRSIVPLLNGRTPTDWRTDFLIEHWRPASQSEEDEGNGAIPDYFGLRNDRYAYIEYATGERELYDLRTDPYQLNSLHGSASSSTLGPLQQRLNALKTCKGAAACK